MTAAGPPFLVSSTGLYESVLGLAAKKARATKQSLDADLIESASATVREFLINIGAREIAITPEIGHAAIEAAKRYGLAVGSPARLNFGDCFAYACAKEHHAVLLYKGNDFAQTDLA